LHRFPDLFCSLYDELDGDLVRESAEAWFADERLGSFAAGVASDVEAGRSAGSVRMRVDNHPDPEGARYAALVGIDRALRHVNVTVALATERPPPSLQALASFVAARGRLDSGAVGGALLPRLVARGRHEGNLSHKRELFANVLRVPEDSWERAAVTWVGEAGAIHRGDLSAGLLVGCVPVIADPAEMSFRVREAGGHRYYRIAAADQQATVARIPQIVAEIDRAGVVIALAPELTLTPTLLAAWQQALRSPERGATRLRLLVPGSGALTGAEGRASNTAPLLDGRTGATIVRQSKLFAFDFTGEELERWKLTGRLGREAVGEDLVPGRRLEVIDAGAARIAILICEDVSRPLDIGPLVRDFGVSLVLAPVFSRPLKARRWENTAGDVHVRETGSTVVFSNSLAMSSILASHEASAMVLAPAMRDALLATSSGPAHVVCFRLLGDGTAEVV
jgi:predicted amidohydrolase